MGWKIDYYSSKVEEDTLALADKLLARYLHLTAMLLEFGPNLGLPHTKTMGKGLFELRLKARLKLAK